MKAVSPQAKAVLATLTRGLKKPGDHREVKNNSTFMSVHVEHIGQVNLGPMFSIAHYYEQNGDLMKDPDMVFIRDENGEFYPFEFQQDNLGLYQCAIEFDQGEIRAVNTKLQGDLVSFANSWMKNIRDQQAL